ncbi:hypothetical protein TWF730_008925 [Orbilia blumenaviensis]|uniref:Uncharacterized protein n=1 Tax=Orbilia blumenaviensis TaxID=1796055 RepID=A0AAV9UXI6_9PEZI
MAGPQGSSGAQGGGNGFYSNRGRGGGGNNGRGNNRRRRPNNQQGQQGAKYTQAHGFQEDGEFQPKLPSDTAPAFRFVERRSRRRAAAGNAGPSGEHHSRDHQGQGAGRAPARDPPPPSTPAGQQENVTPKTLRIVSAPSKLEAEDESLRVEKAASQVAGSTQPAIPEPAEAAVADAASSTGEEEEDGGVPVSWSMAADAQSEAPAGTPSVEELKKVSIRDLLDTSDIIEPITLSKPPFLPAILLEPSTPAHNQPSGVFSSPLTITKTPFNPNNPANAIQEPSPLERFLKLADVTSRYLTERLSDISYNPDLSRRLKSDFEVIETAYNSLRFDRSLNPNRIIWHTLLGLRKAVELRNNDAKIVGALKKMTQTYDTVRHQALHERRFEGEQTLNAVDTDNTAPTAAGIWNTDDRFQAVAQSGEDLMDTLKWNIRGGDTNVRLYEGNGNAGHAVMGLGNVAFENTTFGTTTKTGLGATGLSTTGLGKHSFGASGFSIDGFGTPGFKPTAPVSGNPFGFEAPQGQPSPWYGSGGSFLAPLEPNSVPKYGIIGEHLKKK